MGHVSPVTNIYDSSVLNRCILLSGGLSTGKEHRDIPTLLLVHQCKEIQITEASKPFESEMLTGKYFLKNSCDITGGSAANFIFFLTI